MRESGVFFCVKIESLIQLICNDVYDLYAKIIDILTIDKFNFASCTKNSAAVGDFTNGIFVF